MLGLTPLGFIHTLISLVAVGTGFYAQARYREIALRSGAGKLYIVTTALTRLVGIAFLVYLAGAALQLRRLRTTRRDGFAVQTQAM